LVFVDAGGPYVNRRRDLRKFVNRGWRHAKSACAATIVTRQPVSKLWYYADPNSSGQIGPLTLERLQSILANLPHAGRLIAVLDVSAVDPELSERAHALTGALTLRSACAIEERFFREHFRREWIVAVAPPEGGARGMLLAIDSNQRIMGANRFARTSLMLDDRGLRAGTSLWSIFERNVDIFRHQGRSDFSVRLLIAGSNDSRPALVTPPDRPVTASNNRSHDLHTRPRLGSIDVSTLPPAPQAWGGLSPGAMRRVREYVEVHLGESIDLSMLAGVAGLSVHHFARQFKQSAGVTPHVYLTQKRVERAQEMLVQTDLPLAEIAFAVGFFDQGHLARHFRHLLGKTPREFRWSQR
jgi:AraC-like DNA-binding protein